jgi:hypothetical protein
MTHTCPTCEQPAAKVIAAGMPMKLCQNENCNTVFGEPFCSIYIYCVAPIEGMFNDEFAFLIYEGSYLKALWDWFMTEDED